MISSDTPRERAALTEPQIRRRDEAKALVRELYLDWFGPLMRYALHGTRSISVAEDVVQDAFMDLYRALLEGKWVENPRGWTLCVVRRKIIDSRRTERRHGGPFLSLSESPELAGSVEPAVFAGGETDRLIALPGVLSRREEEVLLLRSRDLKYRQIAAELKISTGSVKTLLARAVRKMQKAHGEAAQAKTESGPLSGVVNALQ